MTQSNQRNIRLLKELTDIGVALSAEKDPKKLLDMILAKAQEMTHADAATLYECTDGKWLQFEIMHTNSLNVHLDSTSDQPVALKPLPIFNDDGTPNQNMVATWVAASKTTVNIDDVYHENSFDFSGTFAFDRKNGYRSQSFLTVPMIDHFNGLIGVLQLINAQDPVTGEITPFSALDNQIAESLASQAAVCITNRNLILAQKELFDSLIQLIAYAIDEKSQYTGGHCRRVPVIARMLAEATCRTNKGPLRDFTMSEDEKYELDVAAWLHDCGKITTPEFVVDKATKLETIFDRIQLVDARFEILKRDATIASLRAQLPNGADPVAEAALQSQLAVLDREHAFIQESNIGKEKSSDKDLACIAKIAQRSYKVSDNVDVPVLSEDELHNLVIHRGTLSGDERDIINNHVAVTLRMLRSLPYPKNLARVPEFAGSHHERMDGKGYPRGLTREQMPLQSRMIALADVFEALTASDRPYKKAMPLSQCLAILGRMKLEGHIDPDLFDVFMHEKLYLVYANKYLDKSLIDIEDVSGIPGYTPLE